MFPQRCPWDAGKLIAEILQLNPFLLSESNSWKSRKQKRSYETQARGKDGPVFSLAKEH